EGPGRRRDCPANIGRAPMPGGYPADSIGRRIPLGSGFLAAAGPPGLLRRWIAVHARVRTAPEPHRIALSPRVGGDGAVAAGVETRSPPYTFRSTESHRTAREGAGP